MSDMFAVMDKAKMLKAEAERKILDVIQQFSDETGLYVGNNIKVTKAQVFGPCNDYAYVDVKIEVSL